jgi:alpha/beta superfamily hydrolase
MPRTESLFLAGPAGRLKPCSKNLTRRQSASPWYAIPTRSTAGRCTTKWSLGCEGLRRSGHVVMRFNHRGVNLSEGDMHGEGELLDARIALDVLTSRYPGLPLTLAGFSFGSRIVLRMGCAADSLAARRVIAVGFPTVYKDRSFLDSCTVPRIFIQSTRDQYGPVDELKPLVEALPEPKQLIWIDAEDHFFAGALEQLEESVIQLG